MDNLDEPQPNPTANPTSPQPPRTPHEWNEAAISALKENNLSLAVENIGRAIALEAGQATDYANRARLLFELGRLDESLKDYSQAIDLEPSSDLYASRSVVNLALGKDAAALFDLNDAYDLDPSLQNLLNRASFFSNKGMAVDAYRDLNTVIEQQPENPDYRLARANLAFALARQYPQLYEQGLADIEEAMSYDQTGTLQATLLQLADQLEAYLPDSPNPTVSRRLIELIRSRS